MARKKKKPTTAGGALVQGKPSRDELNVLDQAADPLTPKQRQFVELYVQNRGNGTQAALEAYDTDDPVTAASIAYENLRKPQIQAYLRELLQARTLTKEQVWQQISEDAQATIADFIDLVPSLHYPTILKPLRTILDELEDEISLEQEYLQTVELSAEERAAQRELITHLERRRERYLLRLARNPDAVEEARGEPVVVYEAVPNLERARAAGKLHLLRGLKRDRHGRLELQLVDTQAAKFQLAKLYEVAGRDPDQVAGMEGEAIARACRAMGITVNILNLNL